MAALRRPSKHATRFAWTKSSTPRPLRSQAPPARPGDAPPSWVKLQLAPPEGALQPSKSQRKCWGRRPPNFSWFSRTLYFNLLSLYVVVVGHLTKYEWYKTIQVTKQPILHSCNITIGGQVSCPKSQLQQKAILSPGRK